MSSDRDPRLLASTGLHPGIGCSRPPIDGRTTTDSGFRMAQWTHFSVAADTDSLWRVTFDNPPINLVTPEMIVELPELVDQMEASPELRVVVFDSANPDYFLNH